MKKVILFTAVAGALSLASCSNENEEPVTPVSSDAPRFSATIGAQQSRAFDTSWENGDAIGISCLTGGKTYTNVAYSTTGDGNFNVVTPGTEIYYQDNNEVTFTAYYPYTANTAAYGAETTNQANQKKFDFLWAQAKGKKSVPNVAFSFAHKMAKVNITVKKGADVSFDEVKAAVLSLDGFKHEGTFNVVDGTAAATGNASTFDFANAAAEAHNAPVKVNDAAETVTYTLIFFPQEFIAALPFTATLTGMQSFGVALDFTAANANKDTDAKNEWVAGRQYNLSVTLNKTSITVNGCTIQPWDEVNGGEFDAD